MTNSYITGSKRATLVTETGTPIGSEDVFKVHQHPTKLHAAASVWIFKDDLVLLQQRSAKKILAANWWANTVCGNVKPDETPLECAYRRLEGELGFPQGFTQISPSYTFTYKAYGNETFSEHEFDHVFVGSLTNPDQKLPQPNPDEVQQTAWVSFSELRNWAKALKFPTTEESLALSNEELKAQTKTHLFTANDQNYEIAPWSIFMLRDDRLMQSVAKSAET